VTWWYSFFHPFQSHFKSCRQLISQRHRQINTPQYAGIAQRRNHIS
jgi:hypothetical protein